MNYTKIKTWIIGLNKIFWRSILALGIPISISAVFGIPIPKTLSLIVSTFTLEYLAVPVGIGLGLNPVFVLITVTSAALSVVLLLLEIFDTVGEKSRWVSNFLSKSREKAQRSKIIRKYGMYGLVPAVSFLGFYVCPAIAWIFGWRRDYAVMLIIAGFAIISTIMLLASIGILGFISG
ncbi:small multi-drug export protein [Candidatus Aerophobetes bacterium]|nr:small multi-drug export protein [Candidatus Aerophobetes bacterium]